MCKHKSRSERALHSQVLRIRLSRQIAIQNAFFPRFKSLIWKSVAFTKGKIRLSNQERVRITFRNGFLNVICFFVNRSVVSYLPFVKYGVWDIFSPRLYNHILNFCDGWLVKFAEIKPAQNFQLIQYYIKRRVIMGITLNIFLWYWFFFFIIYTSTS